MKLTQFQSDNPHLNSIVSVLQKSGVGGGMEKRYCTEWNALPQITAKFRTAVCEQSIRPLSVVAWASLFASPGAAQAHSHTEEAALNSDKLPGSLLGAERYWRTIHKQLKTSLLYWPLPDGGSTTRSVSEVVVREGAWLFFCGHTEYLKMSCSGLDLSVISLGPYPCLEILTHIQHIVLIQNKLWQWLLGRGTESLQVKHGVKPNSFA